MCNSVVGKYTDSLHLELSSRCLGNWFDHMGMTVVGNCNHSLDLRLSNW